MRDLSNKSSSRGAYPPLTDAIYSLADLRACWTSTKAEFVIRADPKLARDWGFLHRVRGTLGRELGRGASDLALSGKPCLFEPPSAYAIFHNSYTSSSDHVVSVPFFLSCDPLPDGLLLVRLRLFGAAVVWMPAFADALTAALQERGVYQPGNGLVHYPVIARVVEEEQAPPPLEATHHVLAFQTPAILRRGNQVIFNPPTVFRSLIGRLETLALLHGAVLQFGDDIQEACATHLVDVPVSNYERVQWRVGKDKSKGKRIGTLAEILIPPGSDALQSALPLGLLCGLGSRVAEGLGRFCLYQVPTSEAQNEVLSL